jgi:hypothetical protein
MWDKIGMQETDESPGGAEGPEAQKVVPGEAAETEECGNVAAAPGDKAAAGMHSQESSLDVSSTQVSQECFSDRVSQELPVSHSQSLSQEPSQSQPRSPSQGSRFSGSPPHAGSPRLDGKMVVPENKACFLEDTLFWSMEEGSGILKTQVQRLEKGNALRFWETQEPQTQETQEASGKPAKRALLSATVRSVRKHTSRSQDNSFLQHLVTIRFGNGFVKVTADHAILIQRDDRVTLARAQDIQQGDFVRAQNGFVKVREVTPSLEDEDVFEVTFSHPDERALISDPRSPLAIQVFGEIPLIHSVKLLVFRRSDGFKRLFLESNELAVCHQALAEENLSMDLYALDLGPGKLVMHDKERAKEVYEFLLARREKRNGKNFVSISNPVMEPGTLNEVRHETKTLDDKCVIVSADMENVVRCLVKRNATEARDGNYVVNEPGFVLDLDIMEHSERAPKRPRHEMLPPAWAGGLISKPSAPRSEGGVTSSTTDGKRPPHGTRCASTTNPRHVPPTRPT